MISNNTSCIYEQHYIPELPKKYNEINEKLANEELLEEDKYNLSIDLYQFIKNSCDSIRNPIKNPYEYNNFVHSYYGYTIGNDFSNSFIGHVVVTDPTYQLGGVQISDEIRKGIEIPLEEVMFGYDSEQGYCQEHIVYIMDYSKEKGFYITKC